MDIRMSILVEERKEIINRGRIGGGTRSLRSHGGEGTVGSKIASISSLGRACKRYTVANSRICWKGRRVRAKESRYKISTALYTVNFF